jgi:hypothetical protein
MLCIASARKNQAEKAFPNGAERMEARQDMKKELEAGSGFRLR